MPIIWCWSGKTGYRLSRTHFEQSHRWADDSAENPNLKPYRTNIRKTLRFKFKDVMSDLMSIVCNKMKLSNIAASYCR